MKVKEVIRQLLEADPTGEEEVSVGNVDIQFIDAMPAYYDGCQQILIRDDSKKPYYDVVGARYRSNGIKIQIHTLSIREAISNAEGKDFPVDYSELNQELAKSTKEEHEKLKKWHQNLSNELELENFIKWVKKRISHADIEHVKEEATEFYKQNITPNDQLPDCKVPNGKSYVDTRHDQWDKKFTVLCDAEGDIIITKKND